MAMLRNVFGGCVSDRSSETMRQQKIKFGAPLSTTLKNGYLPGPLVNKCKNVLSWILKLIDEHPVPCRMFFVFEEEDGNVTKYVEDIQNANQSVLFDSELLIFIAHEGMSTADLFRRPGNPTDTRHIMKRLTEGKPVIYQNYNLYTLASVVKKFLIRLPDGIFGVEGEETLLQVLSLGHKMDQYEAVHEYISSLHQAHQQFISLLFGIWFTMINNSDVNFMTTEALSRSVAGSVFHSCVTDPAKVEKASRIMQLLIENFGVASMFGQENIEYFADTTRTGIHIREKFRYNFQYPSEEILPRKEAVKWFSLYLCQEAQDRGFRPDEHAITEEGFYEMSQMHSQREGVHETSETPEPGSPETDPKCLLSVDRFEDGDSTSSRMMAVSTISAPEVSLAPSPEVNSKRPKSLEDNLNETEIVNQSRSQLSRFNSVKRKQLERLRQRSDWFLGPGSSQVMNQSGQFEQFSHGHERLTAKSSGNSVTKASSEGAALDILSSDADSVFSEESRCESAASEPVRTPPIRVTRDIIHSDTMGDVNMTDASRDSREVTEEDMEQGDSEVCYFVVEHKYGES